MRFNHTSSPRSFRSGQIVLGVAIFGFFLVAATSSAGQSRPIDPPAVAYQGSGGPGDSQDPSAANLSAPQTLILRAGTLVTVRLTDWLSSDQSRQGDEFDAVLEQPLVADGWVVARSGQSVIGLVTVAQKAGRIRGTSQLGVELNELTLVDGQQLPVQTQLLQSSAGPSRGRDALAVGSTTALGAAIGAVVHGGEGAGIGAAAGAAAGIVGILSTRGRPTFISPETLLTFRLEVPVTISTERSQVAFQPVTAEDYGAGAPPRPARQIAVGTPGYGPSPYYPYPYPYGYGYGYGYGYYGYPLHGYYYAPHRSFGYYGGGFYRGHGSGRGGFGHGGYGRGGSGHGGYGRGGSGHGGFGRH